MKVERLVVGPLDTNCYILSENEECVIIDAGGNPDLIIGKLEGNNLRLKAIIATHAHSDHILSVSALKRRFDAPFLISRRDEGIMSGFTSFTRTYFGVDPGPPPIPDIYLDSRSHLTIGDKNLSIVETPGHTPGSCTIVVDDLMFTGDFIFNGTIGRTDFGGSYTDMVSSINWAKRQERDYFIHPGHGELTTLEAEKRSNPFFKELF